jgi:hypothetical protein
MSLICNARQRRTISSVPGQCTFFITMKRCSQACGCVPWQEWQRSKSRQVKHLYRHPVTGCCWQPRQRTVGCTRYASSISEHEPPVQVSFACVGTAQPAGEPLAVSLDDASDADADIVAGVVARCGFEAAGDEEESWDVAHGKTVECTCSFNTLVCDILCCTEKAWSHNKQQYSQRETTLVLEQMHQSKRGFGSEQYLPLIPQQAPGPTKV